MAEDEDKTSQPEDKSEAGRRAAKRQRAPVTIDLEASAVTAGQAAGEGGADRLRPAAAIPAGASKAETEAPRATRRTAPESGQPASPAPRTRSIAAPPPGGNWVGLFAAGLLGALIALLFGYGLVAGGLVPAATDERVDAAVTENQRLAAAAEAAGRRIAVLETKAAGASRDSGRIDSLAGKVDALAAREKTFVGRLDKVEGDLAAPPAPSEPQSPTATSALLDGLVARLDRLESAPSAGDSVPPVISERISTLETRTAVLSGRVDALADRIEKFASRPDAAMAGDKAARAVAIATLRQAADRGGSFAADLAMIAALAPDAAEVAALKPLAGKGAPSKQALADGFPAVVDAILSASAAGTETGGIAERLLSRLRGLVTIRPAGPIAGTTPGAIVSRMQAAVAGGDLAAALKEREGLDEAGKTASAAWAEAAADRVAIDGLVDTLVQAVGTPPETK